MVVSGIHVVRAALQYRRVYRDARRIRAADRHVARSRFQTTLVLAAAALVAGLGVGVWALARFSVG